MKQSFIAKESENKQEKYARLKRKFMWKRLANILCSKRM